VFFNEILRVENNYLLIFVYVHFILSVFAVLESKGVGSRSHAGNQLISVSYCGDYYRSTLSV